MSKIDVWGIFEVTIFFFGICAMIALPVSLIFDVTFEYMFYTMMIYLIMMVIIFGTVFKIDTIRSDRVWKKEQREWRQKRDE